ncbi:MAG: hypothetical protein VX498_14125 [Myxococcota bacterium]|nr:hypothetical protein [Myxococcota bacterium]
MGFPPSSSRLRPLLLGAALLQLLGCVPETAPGTGSDDGFPPPVGRSLASGLEIVAVTINQGVSIDLLRDGLEPELYNAPVIAGRPGLVRVHVQPTDNWEERPILGELLLRSAGGDLLFSEEWTVEVPSAPSDFETTFNFVLGPEAIEEDTTVAVRLWEGEGGSRGGDSSGSAWPPLGTRPLRATSWGGTLRVHLVPVEYNADGSGRLPDTSSEQLQVLADQLTRLYPLRELELVLAEPYASDLVLESNGTGFSDLLEAMSEERVVRDLPFDTYLFALVAPAATHQEFCGLGCTAGLAYRVANPLNGFIKVAVGLGYEGSSAARTLTHEIGHLHDRGHAPCGNAGNPDPSFPHPDGAIGVEGWNIVDEEWVDPSEHADLMGYCTPDWVSDHNYAAFHQRMAAVEGLREARQDLPEAPWLALRVHGDGSLSHPREGLFGFVPEGTPRTLALLGARGEDMGSALGHLVSFADLPGGTLILPSPPAAVRAVRLGDQQPVFLSSRAP